VCWSMLPLVRQTSLVWGRWSGCRVRWSWEEAGAFSFLEKELTELPAPLSSFLALHNNNNNKKKQNEERKKKNVLEEQRTRRKKEHDKRNKEERRRKNYKKKEKINTRYH